MAEPELPNPYAVPASALDAARETEHDRFIVEQVTPLLKPKERLQYTATLLQSPSPALIVGLMLAAGCAIGVLSFAVGVLLPDAPPQLFGGLGGLVGAIIVVTRTRPFLAAVTQKRIVLFRTRVGAFGVRRLNLGVEEIRWKHVERIKVGGFANNRSLTFVFRDLTERTLRISPWSKAVSGQKAFFEYAKTYDGAAPARGAADGND